MRRLVAAAALLLLAGPTAASLVESTTSGLPAHVHYQSDAGTEYDAPDTCAEALSSTQPFDLPVGGEVSGLLLPADDGIDHYRVAVGQDLVGGRLTLGVAGRDLALPLSLQAFMPGCGSDVTAEENQPAAPPSHPAPGPGERQVEPHNMDAQQAECSDRWFFVLNQFGGRTAPAAIHVVWTDGSEADVPLLKGTPATIAQYATSANLGFTLHSVTANVPADWKGQFNVGEAPCGAVDGGAVFGEPSVSTETTVEFTPVEAGVYVLAVRLVPPEPEVPGAVPMSCHAACSMLTAPAEDRGGYDAFAL